MEEWEEVANNRTNNFAVSVFLFYKLNLVKKVAYCTNKYVLITQTKA